MRNTCNSDAFAGYTLSYSGDSDSSGNIILVAGYNKTVTITNNDISFLVTSAVVITPNVPAVKVVKHTVPEVKVVKRTVTGGQLPNTSTPMYELLLIGALTLVGVVGWRRRKRY